MSRMMSGRRSLFVVSLSLAVAVMVMGCTARFHHRTEKMPPDARVAVLLCDDDGQPLYHTMDQAWVYQIIAKAGLQPVALNDVDVRAILGREASGGLFSLGKDESESAITGDPLILSSLQKHFLQKKIDFLLMVYSDTLALDEDLRVILVKTEDMKVIASHFYRHRVMGYLWGGLMITGPFVVAIVPWFYLIDKDKNNHEMLSGVIQAIQK